MNNKLRIVLLVFFAALFIFSAVMLIQQGLEYKKSGDNYNDALNAAGIPSIDKFNEMVDSKKKEENKSPEGTEGPSASGSAAPDETGNSAPGMPPSIVYEGDPYAELLAANVDLAGLKKKNSDIIGWFYIMNTEIMEPLIHYKDNDHYLRLSWTGKGYDRGGVIFMEAKCRPDFNEFNTIIYGHHMRNLTKFGKLTEYKKKSYWQEHPSVYILTDSGIDKYNIYAAYAVPLDGMTYRLSFGDDLTKQEFIDFTLKQTVLKTGIVPTVEDKILTLSTCTGDGYDERWIVQAVLVQHWSISELVP